MSEYIEVGQPLQFTDTNCPTRVGEIVENVNDIYNIPTPCVGMQVFVKSEKKSYVITALKSKTINGVEVPEAAVEAFEPVGAKEITWNNDTDLSNMNDFVVAGVYDIKGERTRDNDNLPILNTGGGHSFNARLTVLDSSIKGTGDSQDKCITQVLMLSNRTGEDGNMYIRTGHGGNINSLSWEPWATLQKNTNVDQVNDLDNLKDNGIYSGVWTKGSYAAYPLTFVCIVINDYFVAAPRRISQFVYGLSKFDGSVVYQSRVWDDSKGMWGDWEILNQKEIASMISAEIKKVTDGIDPNKIDSLKDIITWIEEHGDVADILAAIEGLNNELGREIDARMSADNDTRGKGVLFGGFSNRQTTANEVVIGYKNIAQNAEGAFSIPAATTEKAGVMSTKDKEKLDSIEIINNLTTGGADKALSAEMGKAIVTTINDAINNIKPVVINGNVTNAADEEDITSEDNLLKFKDRTYLAGTNSGLGYVILRKNKTFAEQLTQANTVYEIRYDFDLGEKEVAIPNGCTLKFEGGKLLNGILKLNYTTIQNPFDGCFSNTYISKSGLYEYQNVFTNDVGLSSWFDGDDSNVIQSLASFRKVILTRDYNIINTNININHSFELNGQGHYLTIEKTRETEDEISYVFMSTVNPATDETSPNLNIFITNLNVIMRSTIFGETVEGSTWGYRGVFMQAFGHNVTLDNVNINTNGTILTCWGYTDEVADRLGQLFVINSTLKASMFIVEDTFKLATFTNSELSIDKRDKFRYQDYILSNMHDIVIDNCTVVGGIETKYRSSLGYSNIYVYNSVLDYAFAVYSSDNRVNVTITGCVFRVLSKTAVNTNTNGKLRYWGGINVLSMERNLFDISFTNKYQMVVYLYGSVDNISINYNTFQNIDNNENEFERIIHAKKTISSITFIGNRIVTASNKIIMRMDFDYNDDNFANCRGNYINNPINTKLSINGTDRVDLAVKFFDEERKGYSSGRPSVLTTLNAGYRYFDITKKLPIIWDGNRWILGDGFSPFKHSGWSGARPTGSDLDKSNDIGFYFFDRNLNKPIFIKSISDDGVITWVDATGTEV